MDGMHSHGSAMLPTTVWSTALWKCDKIMLSKELFQWFVDLMYFHMNNLWIICLKKKAGGKGEGEGKQLVFQLVFRLYTHVSNRRCLLQSPCHLLWFTRVCFLSFGSSTSIHFGEVSWGIRSFM